MVWVKLTKMKNTLIVLFVLCLCTNSVYSQAKADASSSAITKELLESINNLDDSLTKIVFNKMQSEELDNEPAKAVKEVYEVFDLINKFKKSSNDLYLLVQDSILIQTARKNLKKNDVFMDIEINSSNKRFVFRPYIDSKHLFLTERNRKVLNNFIEFINTSIEYKAIWSNGKIVEWNSPIFFDPILKRLSNYIPFYKGERGESASLDYFVISQVSFNKIKTKAMVEVEYLTSGERFYLEKKKGCWKIVESFTTWIE